jgi:hypothetical protein
MKYSKFILAIVFCVLTVCHVTSQEEEKRSKSIIGSRVGLSYYVIDGDEYNDIYQVIKPNANINYSPLMSQFGVSVENLFLLGNTKHNFSLQGVLMFGGIDKSVLITTASQTLGVRFSNGFLFGFGPVIIINDQVSHYEKVENEYRTFDAYDVITLTLEYTIEERLNIDGILIPINLRAMLNPKDNKWKITLLTGFDFDSKGFKFSDVLKSNRE